MAQYGLAGEEYLWEESGYWNWNADMETVANVFLRDHTIGEGGVLPGISDWRFQKQFATESVRKTVEQMEKVKAVSVIPYPPVFLTDEQRSAIASSQYALSSYADTTMACFVTGDLPLTDEEWEKFCGRVKELGLETMIGIWQKACE